MNEKLEQVAGLLANWTIANRDLAPNRLDIKVLVEDLQLAVAVLRQSNWGHLSAITGLDQGREAGKIEALYQFCFGADVLTLRVALDRTAPALPSICGIVPAADVLEWELSEMFGITIGGSPNRKHLYLPNDWPEEVYPMRKDAAVAVTD